MMGNGGGRPQAKHTETVYEIDMEKHEAFWQNVIVERVEIKSDIIHFSGKMNKLESTVISVGNGISEDVDLLPGDKVVFGGQVPATSLEAKGPNGGTLIAVPIMGILCVDRTSRGIKPRLPFDQHLASRVIKKRAIDSLKMDSKEGDAS